MIFTKEILQTLQLPLITEATGHLVAQLAKALEEAQGALEQHATHECSVRTTMRPLDEHTETRCGSIICHADVGGNLRISKSHTPSERIMIERGDLDDLKAALDAILKMRDIPPNEDHVVT